MHKNPSFLLFLKILFTSTIFCFLLYKLDFNLIKKNLQNFSLLTFALSICWFWLGIATGTKRWQEIIASHFHKLPFFELWRQTMIGSFLNQCLPSSIGGDVYRGFSAKRFGMTTEWAINSTLIDRLFGLISLVIIGLVCLPFNLSILFKTGLGICLIFCLLGTGIGFILLVLLSSYANPALKKINFMKPLTIFSDRLVSTLTQKKITFKIFLFSLFTASGLILPLYFTSLSMHLPLTFSQISVSIPFIFLVSVLPFSFAGWGLREGAMVATLGLFGVSKEEAFCLSVIFGFIQLIASLPGAFVWLAYRSSSLPSKPR